MPPRGVGRKAKRLKAFFKNLVRKVILCRYLLTEIDNQIGLDPKRNVIILTRRKRSTSLLTSYETLLFQIPQQNRTIENRKTILRIVANLKCFQMYPPKIRARIAPYLEFIKIDINRTVMRAGHRPTYVYFLLTGEIVAYQMIEEPYTKKIYRKDKYIVTAGDVLGHISLYQNRCRSHTFHAITDVECLFLDKEIFQKYLMPFELKNIEAKNIALNSYDTLNQFNIAQRQFVTVFGRIKQYEPMETIYHVDRGDLNFVYFIISGECMILQYLKTNVTFNCNNKKEYTLCPINETDFKMASLKRRGTIALLKDLMDEEKSEVIPLRRQTIISLRSSIRKNREHHFIDVGTLTHGAMFGLGEPMEDRAIMARTLVQCLLIPRFWLLSREQNPGNIWRRLELSFRATIPSRQQLFDALLIDKKSKHFKKDYIFEKLDGKRKQSNPTKTEDIPLLCRVVEYTLEDDSDDDQGMNFRV